MPCRISVVCSPSRGPAWRMDPGVRDSYGVTFCIRI
jgi:hypothetical protein